MSIEFVYGNQSYLGVHFLCQAGFYLSASFILCAALSLFLVDLHKRNLRRRKRHRLEHTRSGWMMIMMIMPYWQKKLRTFPLFFSVLSTATTTATGDGNSTATAASALTNSACRTHSSAILTATNSHSLSQSLGSQQPPSEAANSSSVAEVGDGQQQQQQTNQVQRKCFLEEIVTN